MKLRSKITIAILLLIIVPCLTVGWWRYRAKAALAACEKELRSRGEKLLVEELIPAPTTNLPNGAAMVVSAANNLSRLKPDAYLSLMRMVAPGRARAAWQQARVSNSTFTNVWPALGAYVETNREALSELCLALEQCNSIQFRGWYSFDAPLSQMLQLRPGAQALVAALAWELHNQQPQNAWTNLRAITALATKYDPEAFKFAHVIRATFINFAFVATWEALQYEHWTDSQLAELEAMWNSLHCIETAGAAIAMERAMAGPVFDRCRQNATNLTAFLRGTPGGSVVTFLREMADEVLQEPKETLRDAGATLAWSGWASYDDERWLLQAFQLQLDALRATARTGNMQSYFSNTNQASRQPARGHFISGSVFGDMRSFVRRIVLAETASRLLATALAIRRYQLRHGRLPAEIHALVPDFISSVPRDPMDGQPLRYRPQDDRTFLLYSVGLDGKDDGGNAVPPDEKKARPPFHWQNGRDWVWPQPASVQEIEADNARLDEQRKPPGR